MVAVPGLLSWIEYARQGTMRQYASIIANGRANLSQPVSNYLHFGPNELEFVN